MSEDWADRVARDFQRQGLLERGACLLLGGADTGKTTLASALAARIAQSRPVAIVDADIGQSHIGPPSTVGWAVVDNPNFDLSAIEPGGIAFVGDITPVGHLLQFTAALTRCVEQAAKLAEVRSFLTMLGVVFGVGSVVAMLSVGEGAIKDQQKDCPSL